MRGLSLPAKGMDLEELQLLTELVDEDEVIPGLLGGFPEEIVHGTEEPIIMSGELGIEVGQAV